ncbi:MAG: hypothetical protein JSV40_08800 [Deltaproteobacteria bacterium]|nr:MAG: hypothetical protein JSV40_08800 [Deltaproteobacteria bacterium]
MLEDIRDKPYLNHGDVVELNFIRSPAKFHYRRHYRAGLRSHIMEVLKLDELNKETEGVTVNRIKWYPRAKPIKILRLFRIRFKNLEEAREEVKRVRIVQAYLDPDHVALTEEFLVDYIRGEKRDILLCGLQEYVEGEVIEPWGNLGEDHLLSLISRMASGEGGDPSKSTGRHIWGVKEKADVFVKRIKQMIREAEHIPDLAGAGNLLLTRSGNIKLVDVNNISRVLFDATIQLDDRGYPVCDKSIQALSLLEQKLLGRSPHEGDGLYETFLDPERMKAVRKLEEDFNRTHLNL